MLGRQLEGLQFVGALFGIGPGLRHVEAELDALGVGGVVAEVLGPGAADEEARRRQSGRRHGAALQEPAPIEVLVEDRHCRPPFNEPTLGAPASSGASCSVRISSEHREDENAITNYWQINEYYVNRVDRKSTRLKPSQ